MNSHHLDHLKRRLASSAGAGSVSVSVESLTALIEVVEAQSPAPGAVEQFEKQRGKAIKFVKGAKVEG